MISIIVAIVGALLGVYLRESVRHAFRQKTIVAKLGAEIEGLKSDVLMGSVPQLLELAEAWYKERIKAKAERGAEDAEEVDKIFEEKLKGVKETVEKGDKEFDKSLRQQYELFREMPDRIFEYYIEQYKIVRDRLLSDSELISRDDAAELGWHVAAPLVRIRSRFIRVIHQNITTSLLMREMDRPDMPALRSLLFPSVDHSVHALVDILDVSDVIEDIRRKPVILLTLENILALK